MSTPNSENESNAQTASIGTESKLKAQAEETANSVLDESDGTSNRDSSEQNVNPHSENKPENLQSQSSSVPIQNPTTEGDENIIKQSKEINSDIKPIGYHYPILINTHYYPLNYNKLEKEEKFLFSSLKEQDCLTPEEVLCYILWILNGITSGCFYGYSTRFEYAMLIDGIYIVSVLLVLIIWIIILVYLFGRAQHFPKKNPVKLNYYEEIYMP